ncbi:DUF4350 domain-containing protein [Mucilaginibacter pedocola]|uniref:DUF4350 domain-containing protein n=1 Tax=Mucilaginibacter pedocola TaxID=1792845 RepID=A0A1S9PBW4_9SPHI|nr:DUF4350 domain-containing protein [Mucilaginibacter pedocola]OOQ58474.1 hypothetical protein BC343_07325 [Mucilaginibacter pedocola]
MKDFKIYIGIASALLLVYLIAQYNKPTPINWESTLYYNDKIPFGTFIMYNRLGDMFPDAEVTRTNKSAYEVFSDTLLMPGNYLVIANNVDLSKADYTAMVDFISKGNSVFISAFAWDGVMMDTLNVGVSTELTQKDISVNFNNLKLKQAKNYVFDKHITDEYFTKFDTTRATVIGQNSEGHANYISYSFGKGKLFLFTNPQVFTNYSLLKPQSADYAEKALSYLPANADNVYWDQYQNHDIPTDESPMRVFFQYPALQWAYYIALAAMLLFVVYEIKRRQRIIPVVEPLKNSTLDFVSVVGKVYYEQRDNSNITAKKILYFSEHLRNTFGLKMDSQSPEFTERLANKTGIERSLADELVNHMSYLARQVKVTDYELIVLNQLIEKFYTQTGSYGK